MPSSFSFPLCWIRRGRLPERAVFGLERPSHYNFFFDRSLMQLPVGKRRLPFSSIRRKKEKKHILVEGWTSFSVVLLNNGHRHTHGPCIHIQARTHESRREELRPTLDFSKRDEKKQHHFFNYYTRNRNIWCACGGDILAGKRGGFK